MRTIATTEACKMIRQHLKAAFPGTKFSVRKDGWCIRISYNDASVSRASVEAITNKYQGKGFDGSIDLSFYYSVYVKDGKAVGRKTDGTADSMGYVEPHDDAVEGAELVSMSTDYISVSQEA